MKSFKEAGKCNDEDCPEFERCIGLTCHVWIEEYPGECKEEAADYYNGDEYSEGL